MIAYEGVFSCPKVILFCLHLDLIFVFRSNMSLVKRNAEIGADIANSISDLLTKDTVLSPEPQLSQPRSRVVCVGGSVIDTIAKASSSYLAGTSIHGIIHRSGKMLWTFSGLHLSPCWLKQLTCTILGIARWRRRAKYSRGSRTAWIEALFLHGHRRQV